MAGQKFTSPYSPNTASDRLEMLAAIGVDSVDELFDDIPLSHRDPSLDLPKPLSELELKREIENLGRQNIVPGDYASFLGAGSYRHYVPAVVRHIASRGEYMTSYTPYQPEVAQGTLQTTFEFQSLVCLLTGMDVANAGMYDGSTALAEAALMAARTTRRDRVVVLDTVAPWYREVVQTYAGAPGLKVDTVGAGHLALDEEASCLVVQQPNYLGYMEDLADLSERAHAAGALMVVACDPMSLGMFKPPGDYDADIVAAEGQSMGVPCSYGGPYVGIFACKERFLRQMPGRIVGKTVDTNGRTGYVLTLQAREQHIRRERATSNICTAVALIALTATAYMATLGKQGLRHIAELCYHKAHYAATVIDQVPGYSLPVEGTFFREFVVTCPGNPAAINERLLDYGIIGGLDVSDAIPKGMLFCVTEMNSRQEIDSLAAALAEIGAAS